MHPVGSVFLNDYPRKNDRGERIEFVTMEKKNADPKKSMTDQKNPLHDIPLCGNTYSNMNHGFILA